MTIFGPFAQRPPDALPKGKSRVRRPATRVFIPIIIIMSSSKSHCKCFPVQCISDISSSMCLMLFPLHRRAVRCPGRRLDSHNHHLMETATVWACLEQNYRYCYSVSLLLLLGFRLCAGLRSLVHGAWCFPGNSGIFLPCV